LDDQLAELAAETGSDTRKVAQATEYLHRGKAFAVRHPDGAIELRLTSEIAEAARRTPDTDASVRGDDWVHFAPRCWDDHARDRLEAWFRVAWRFAGE